MSKKFLPFAGRLAYRRNGLIDITSPDDALAGFRATLKPGTDSHALAEEALSEAGLFPSGRREIFAAYLHRDSDELAQKGILMGLTEEGEPLYLRVPEPGAALWVLGFGAEQSAHTGRLLYRCNSLPGQALRSYGRAMTSVVRRLSTEEAWVKTPAELDALVEKYVALQEAREPRFVQFLFVDATASRTLLEGMLKLRKTLAEARIVLVLDAPSDRGFMAAGDTALYFPGARSRDPRASLPSNWATEVPLDRAFYLTPQDAKAVRFRAL